MIDNCSYTIHYNDDNNDIIDIINDINQRSSFSKSFVDYNIYLMMSEYMNIST